MSSFEVWTWLAIAVLVLGSLAVFGWFLADVRGVMRGAAPASALPEPSGDGERDVNGERG